MKRFTMFACLALALMFAMSSVAGEMPRFTDGDSGTLYGGVTNFSKASRDTYVMIGPVPGIDTGLGYYTQVNGTFENAAGLPDWNGWTHYDITQPTIAHWNISDYYADNLGLTPTAGNLAAWCGDITIDSCGGGDPVGGYDNAWNDILEWRTTVANPAVGVDVTFTAYANIDSEPGYDYTHIQSFDENGNFDVPGGTFDGLQPNLFINLTWHLDVADYQGDNNDEVVVRINFTSDGGWSDGDCSWPTAGAVQIDEITVTTDQGAGVTSSYTDFEDGWGDWAITFPVGVGDFAKIWTNLEDVDPCSSNYGPQVAFIDDGIVVPGTGGSQCSD